MITINTALALKGLNGAFFPALQETKSLWRLLCTVVKSQASREDYRWLGQVGMPREWKGGRQFKPLRNLEYTIVNKDWEASMAIDRSELADDQSGQLAKRAAELGTRFMCHPDKMVVELMVAGHTGTLGLAYDGQYFYDDDHAEGDSGSQSNNLTGAIVNKDQPTTAEFKIAFTTCVQAMMSFKDDQGEPINDAYGEEAMGGLVATVPVSMFFTALEALSVAIVGSTGNIIAKTAKVVAVPRLSASDVFHVHKVDDPVGPFIFQQRQPIQTVLKDDREDKDVKYMADARYNVGFGYWQKSVRFRFTTAD